MAPDKIHSKNMLSKDKILRETSPLSIFFVKSGSSGNRLLFRYPYDESYQNDPISGVSEETILPQDHSQVRDLINEKDEALCNVFSVNPNLCGQKFEIKINNIRHVGHPMSLLSTLPLSAYHTSSPFQTITSQPRHAHHQRPSLNIPSFDCLTSSTKDVVNSNKGDITSFNIVCALRANASYDIVDCYYDLSKRLAIALSFEERRCSYLSNEIKTILTAMDDSDMANLVERDRQESLNNKGQLSFSNQVTSNYARQDKTVFNLILKRSSLVRDLKRIFISLSTTGIVDMKINNWVRVSFCLPQKVHRLKLLTHKSMPAISTRDIKKCLLHLRPYHGLLLLQEPHEILDSLPIDASPAFIQLIRVSKPDKNFMDLSVDANLTLLQVFCIVSQLLYWTKATIIYPICDSNIYAIHPLASIGTQSKLMNDFRIRFPNSKSLHHYLADFSEGTSLSQLNGPLLSVEEKLNLMSIVAWLLQRRILIQVHKYIFLVVDRESDDNNSNKHQAHLDNESRQPTQGIEINPSKNNSLYSQSNDVKVSSVLSNSIGSSPNMFKNSLTESLEGSLRRYRTDSFPESQEDANFGLNFSLSSTPNSNLDYPSPGNDVNMRSSVSSSCMDNQMILEGTETALSALQNAGLSLAGARNVLSIPSSKNPEDIRLLIRLIPYFDGKHHIEDIMFSENLERSQVLILCDKFREILFTCHYEDIAVSQPSPFNNIK